MERSFTYIVSLTKSPLILGKSIYTNDLRNKVFKDLKDQGANVGITNLQFDCCYEDISRVKNFISKNNHDSIIAVGGGKVLDSGKYIAECLNIPCITVPLSASTCAGWTAYQIFIQKWPIYKRCFIKILSKNSRIRS